MQTEYVSKAGYVAAVLVIIFAFATAFLKEAGLVEAFSLLALYGTVVVVFVAMFAYELFAQHTHNKCHNTPVQSIAFSPHRSVILRSVSYRFITLLLPLLVAYALVHGLAGMEFEWYTVHSHVLVFYGYAMVLFVISAPIYMYVTLLYRGELKYEFNDYAILTMVGLRALYGKLAGKSAYTLYKNRRVKKMGLVYVVNFFFITLMAHFLLNEHKEFTAALHKMLQEGFSAQHWFLQVKSGFGVLLHLLFTIDVSIGMIGYAFASRWLGNRTKSVETSIIGWAVALACYPPLNSMIGAGWFYFGEPQTQSLIVSDVGVTVVMALLLVAYSIYVWATVAMGFKFSNLTNRGIVTAGPYRFVRHPAYASKNIAWIIDSTHVFTSVWATLIFFSWTTLYTLRALTEERHLKKDKAYEDYVKKVPYRFIPKVF